MNAANRITIARIALLPLLVVLMQPYPAWMSERYELIRLVDEYGMITALIVFLVAAATDKLDGYVARRYDQVTNLGKLLDPLADKLFVLTVLILLVQGGHLVPWIAVVLIGREAVITSVRLLAAAKGIVLAADRFGKWKMVLQVAALAVVMLGQSAPAAMDGVEAAGGWLMAAAVAATVLSGFHYIRSNYATLRAG
ncbi:CDP-diacylglycerol--glycerol-3-phosphate 3-phosphatidyltransferase [Paenibacillus flagellatus]|uniref:CDP-diacylglycerol--glycerol-3-phosphate 3-phosphatidyltransferase n=2 Tax=Paenibacillus flagellatus TaxID=2211139 RepID=A0A2V5K719_9BACL|nr:CDP-diacylglycerol--glycerol-3-phosphate 3-phosphatidyltransferase [Paenibacillus flagellatus]